MLKTQSKTRIGRIRYTNCLPFYHGLHESEFSFYPAVPTEINAAMRKGAVDIAPISSLEYLLRADQYLLLPGFAVASRDFSNSVLLFSHCKIENLNHAKIAVTRDSLSSAALLKVLLRFKYKFENEFVPQDSNPEAMLERYPAALVIGDDALFFKSESFLYKYDLAELWWNWTEKPFCFALWAVRRAFAESAPEEVSAFCRRLKANSERNLADLQALIRDALGIPFFDERFSKIFGYLFSLHYSLDETVKEGLELFFRFARRLKIAARPGKLEFFKAS